MRNGKVHVHQIYIAIAIHPGLHYLRSPFPITKFLRLPTVLYVIAMCSGIPLIYGVNVLHVPICK